MVDKYKSFAETYTDPKNEPLRLGKDISAVLAYNIECSDNVMISLKFLIFISLKVSQNFVAIYSLFTIEGVILGWFRFTLFFDLG